MITDSTETICNRNISITRKCSSNPRPSAGPWWKPKIRSKSWRTRYAGEIDRVLLIGCGDPYMLGQAAVYALENWAGVKAEAVEAAEFALYRHAALDPRTLVIAITSSGKTVKAVDAARLARRGGAQTLALTNLAPSPICAEVDDVLQTRSTPSNSFPTLTTTIALAALL